MIPPSNEQVFQLDLPWLHQIDLAARQRVGSKAAVLGALLRAGLPTPEGFCIPEQVLERLFIAGPDALEWQALQAAYLELAEKGQPVIVRSSAAGEDGRAASYAGQFESITGIHTWDELCSALLRCWEAARGERVKLYQTRQPAPPGTVNLFIQRQVHARVSGVLFTRDPLTGSAESLLVEAAPGLGEDLLAGRVSPWRMRLDRSGKMEFTGGDDAPAILAEIPWLRMAQMAEQIERLLGPGQDVEWAYGSCQGEEQLWIVQARPITTGSAYPLNQQYWTRANVAEVLPDPVTPLTWTVFQDTLAGGDYLRQVNGRVYVRLDGMLASFSYLPAVTPQVMTQALGIVLPAAYQDFSPALTLPARLAQGLFWLDALAGLPRLQMLVNALPEPPRPGAKFLPAMLDWTRSCFQLHLKTTAYAIGAYAVLARLFARWLPANQRAGALAALLHGQAELQTAAQGRELWQMAAEIQAYPSIAGLVSARLPWKVFHWQADRLDEGKLFLGRLEQFLAAHGARAAGEFELAVPRWREDPHPVLNILASYLASQQTGTYLDNHPFRDLNSRREAARVDLEKALNPAQLWFIKRLLRSYQRYTTWRENVKYRLIEGYALLRQAFLEVGRQMASTGQLRTPEDVFFLRLEELPGYRFSGAPVPGVDEIAARRSEQAAWQAVPAPLLWVEHSVESASQDAGGAGDALQGIGCSPGVVEGRARVILQMADAAQLQPGEVLVAPHTDPGWTPLFLTCAAVVTEVGGFLSHGATVAREYGLPCVVNVRFATHRIRTGDRVRVDGAAGRVSILEPGKVLA